MADETTKPPPAPSSGQPTDKEESESPAPVSVVVTDSESLAMTEKEDEPPTPPPAPSSDQPTYMEESPAPVSVVVTESESLLVAEKKEQPPTPLPAAESGPLVVLEEKEELPPSSVAAVVEVKTSATQDGVTVFEDEKQKPTEKKMIPQSLVSFKEESNLAADLSDPERKALQELKQLVQEALDGSRFTFVPPPKGAEKQSSTGKAQTKQEDTPARIEENPEKEAQEVSKEVEEVSIWGVPLLKDDRTDVILLKFLRARDFKVKDAFIMIRNTIKWRKEFGVDALIDQDLGDEWEKVVFMHGYDREEHPVCYNVYGEFQNKEVYAKAFSDEEKRAKFLRWRIQFLERSIRKLDFSPGGVCTIFQVNDLKNSPGPAKRELRLATKQALQLLQDNYPEFVAKQVFINVPWWYLAFYTMISPFMTQRTKSKFVFTGPSKTAETLFKYISPEQVPVQYGGLSVDYCDCNPEFSISDPVTDVTVKPATKQTVEIIIYEKCIIVWELRVVGWEVTYGAEFVPNAEDGYTVVIHKSAKKAPTDEPVVSNSFKVVELGKILLRQIKSNGTVVGFRKALVFYIGKAPKGKKTDWIMHEFRVKDSPCSGRGSNGMRLDDWVLCRIYKKPVKSTKTQTDDNVPAMVGSTSLQDDYDGGDDEHMYCGNLEAAAIADVKVPIIGTMDNMQITTSTFQNWFQQPESAAQFSNAHALGTGATFNGYFQAVDGNYYASPLPATMLPPIGFSPNWVYNSTDQTGFGSNNLNEPSELQEDLWMSLPSQLDGSNYSFYPEWYEHLPGSDPNTNPDGSDPNINKPDGSDETTDL